MISIAPTVPILMPTSWSCVSSASSSAALILRRCRHVGDSQTIAKMDDGSRIAERPGGAVLYLFS